MDLGKLCQHGGEGAMAAVAQVIIARVGDLRFAQLG